MIRMSEDVLNGSVFGKSNTKRMFWHFKRSDRKVQKNRCPEYILQLL